MVDDHDRLIVLESEFREYKRVTEARLEKLNELRAEVTHDRAVYLRTDIYEIHHQELSQKLDALTNRTAWQAILITIGAALLPVTAVIGAWLDRIWRSSS